MATYLITGGAGFFGSILKEMLLDNSNKCISVDIVEDDFKHENYTAIKGDIRDKELLRNIFTTHKFDGVFHCAAILAHVKKDIKNLWTSNVDGTRNIVDLAKEFNIKNLVFISTNCLWAKNFLYPVKEDEIPEPIEIYGKSKYEAEKILFSYKNNINSVIFRCPTIMDEGRLGLLGILFEFIDENRKIWMVGDGENKYQFIYAKDLAKACINAINYNQTEIFNIGADNVKSFNDVYNYVINKTKSKSKLVHLPKNILIFLMKICYMLGISPLGPYQYKMISSNFVFDTSKIKEKLNFMPTLSNEEMLLVAYNYYKNNKNEILNRKNASAHRTVANMGIIKLLKYFS